jgi:exosortase/archaeosortase family protein
MTARARASYEPFARPARADDDFAPTRVDNAMNRRVGTVLWSATAIVLSTVGGFALLQAPVRIIETKLSANLAGWLTGSDLVTSGTDVFIFPDDASFFRAVLTPSCSALAAVLAIATLGWLSPGRSARRRLAAVAVACFTVFAGNMIRLVGSLAMGAQFGKIGLIAFHDIVGSTLTFVYILTGYILMLRVLLPKETQAFDGSTGRDSTTPGEYRTDELV